MLKPVCFLFPVVWWIFSLCLDKSPWSSFSSFMYTSWDLPYVYLTVCSDAKCYKLLLGTQNNAFPHQSPSIVEINCISDEQLLRKKVYLFIFIWVLYGFYSHFKNILVTSNWFLSKGEQGPEFWLVGGDQQNTWVQPFKHH